LVMSDHHYISLNNTDDDRDIRLTTKNGAPSRTTSDTHHPIFDQKKSSTPASPTSPPPSIVVQSSQEKFADYDDHVGGDGQDPITFCFFIMQVLMLCFALLVAIVDAFPLYTSRMIWVT
jgi:hypothetical protein